MRSKIKICILLLCILLTGCKEKTFKVTFDTMGGVLLESISVEDGELLKDIKVPTKEGYLFVSWLKDGIEYDFTDPITEDITLTASWIETPELIKYYTVTFVMEDHVEKVTVNENETVKPFPAKEKEDHTFIGWYSGEELYDFNTPVTKNFSLLAKYDLNLVTVTYDLNGGFGLALETVKKNSQATIPEAPTKTGYKFLKWTLNGEEFSFDTPITEDITLKAEWTLIEYITVTFDTDGAGEISPLTIEKHSQISRLPVPNKIGYTFKEWQLNGEWFDFDTPITEDITLKAVYIENN